MQFGTAVVPIVFTELVNVLRRVLTLLVFVDDADGVLPRRSFGQRDELTRLIVFSHRCIMR